MAADVLYDHVLPGFSAPFHVFKQGLKVAGRKLGMAPLPVNFAQGAVLPAGNQPGLAGVRIVPVHPLTDIGAGIQRQVDIATVVLNPCQ